MNVIQEINRLNATELFRDIQSSASWHATYKDSAYIFAGGFPYNLTEGDLIAVFSQYGEIVDLNLARDKQTGKSKGFAFVAYEDQRSTVLAVDNFNGMKLLGRTVRVDHVKKYRGPNKDDDEYDSEEERRKKLQILPPHLRPQDPNAKAESESEEEEDPELQALKAKAAALDEEDPMREYMLKKLAKKAEKAKSKRLKKEKKEEKKKRKGSGLKRELSMDKEDKKDWKRRGRSGSRSPPPAVERGRGTSPAARGPPSTVTGIKNDLSSGRRSSRSPSPPSHRRHRRSSPSPSPPSRRPIPRSRSPPPSRRGRRSPTRRSPSPSSRRRQLSPASSPSHRRHSRSRSPPRQSQSRHSSSRRQSQSPRRRSRQSRERYRR
ncbi:hypothetical protein DFS34DRAFT_67180 [Phlyctochytrium arcticum]|nr:hypothetical protein DFS34DRAFT_67180 [Phlyctochytrium arcticum]